MKKVLLVEDEANIRESIQEILMLHGYTVITAENGKVGLYMASTEKPDLIISDVQMPELTGYELLDLLQKNSELMNIPFIFLTSQIEHDKVRFGMNLGADDYLAKPVRMKDLLNAVDNRLQKSEKLKKVFDDKINEILVTINQSAQHEFNTPLHGILGFSDLILSSKNVSQDKIMLFAQAIQTAGLRLKDTLDNILLYRSLMVETEMNSKSVTVIDTDVLKIWADPILKKYKRENSLVVKDIVRHSIEGSPKYIQKIFVEILDNACKFSPEHEEILILQNGTKTKISYFIKDKGRGMDYEQISQIAPFRQFERQLYEQQGLGLGLFIAKRLVELHKGSLTILPGEPKGLNCIITFPLADK